MGALRQHHFSFHILRPSPLQVVSRPCFQFQVDKNGSLGRWRRGNVIGSLIIDFPHLRTASALGAHALNLGHLFGF